MEEGSGGEGRREGGEEVTGGCNGRMGREKEGGEEGKEEEKGERRGRENGREKRG